MACVPCRLVRQEREILGKHQRFPKISFTRDHAFRVASTRFTTLEAWFTTPEVWSRGYNAKIRLAGLHVPTLDTNYILGYGALNLLP